jgi:hypothetical protein
MARLEERGAKATAMRIVEQGETFKGWTSRNLAPGFVQLGRLQCLPATVDPREPKGK